MILLTPTQIKDIRVNKLHITQATAASIFGGGLHAFHFYEHGKRKPSIPLQQLLTLLDWQPALIHKLKDTGLNYGKKE